MNAIPTKYAGVQFRSRLEARWAAFFDLSEWPWEYEPIDLAGYIPDFILGFYRPLLIEVKPVIEWPCPVVACSTAPMNEHGQCRTNPQLLAEVRKVQRSGWTNEAVMVGSYPSKNKYGDLSFGKIILGELDAKDYEQFAWFSDAEPFVCNACEKLSFCSSTHSYACRVSGCYDGDAHKDADAARPLVEHLWREAGNSVQWRRP